MKVTIIGGGGLRTPLVLYGLGQSNDALNIDEVVLFDVDEARMEIIARLGREVLRQFGSPFPIRISTQLQDAVDGAAFVLNSIRVGGMAARALDERIALEHGLAGQETTGPGGAAMALRTVPVVLSYARTIERVAPQAWFINLTNPAGLITQSLTQNTALRVIGICDTPSELFHNIAQTLGEPQSDLWFDYAGLNHLGWIRKVSLRGQDITSRILGDHELLRQLYPADLFDPALIETLGLIPSEYLFFYYSQRRAYNNQIRAGTTRGAELERLNSDLFRQMQEGSDTQALSTYTAYLQQRNASYLKLESEALSMANAAIQRQNPFEGATGYHRIALEVMTALTSTESRQVVVNVQNGKTIPTLSPEDVIEVPCRIDMNGAVAEPVGELPESVRGLVISVKAYERTLIRAAMSGSAATACLAMLECPIIGQWELSRDVLQSLRGSDREFLGYLT
ncbi:MAG TPA: 6-phospho-beta-glucosidase [Bryobacteraceae bacterium]|nr:6-phospho-beta-glucosidase [Bryobacteraceae bacterium]